jgi:DNA-binding NarL/FixJ family response regulator
MPAAVPTHLKIVRANTPDSLTARESDVFRLLATGATNADMARILELAEGTIRNVVARVTVKLRVADRTQAALLAYRAGLTEGDAARVWGF